MMQWTGTLLRNVACFRLRSAGLAMWFVHGTAAVTELSGADLGGVCRGCAQLVFCKKIKTMWFIGVEVEQETSAAPPKKNPGSILDYGGLTCFLATSSSFLCAGTLSPRGKCCNFLREV